MPSYVITGTSKGLGWEFLRQLSQDQANTVIGIVRNKPAVDKRVSEELSGRSNITILQADLTDYKAIKGTVEETAKITGGGLDVLIANAAYMSSFDSFDGIGDLAAEHEKLEEELTKYLHTNITSNIHLFNLFLPLILKGQTKKVIAITSGHADLDSINKFELAPAPLYSISKAGMNVAVGKFHAQYKQDGVLFTSVSPGVVDVGRHTNATPEQMAKMGKLFEKFVQYNPDFKMNTPDAAVKDMLTLINRITIEDGFGGAYVSEKGDQKWI
jgi:NAD(P)-dependent dehydrogenase (short-subunit alcohol dehydrogenase family)